MRFIVCITAPPTAPACRRALRFTEALLHAGHKIVRLFFYQEGVMVAGVNHVVAQDEVDIAGQWRNLIREHDLDSVVCISAALRHGILNETEAARFEKATATLDVSWDISGLGQLHAGIQEADRLVSFGGFT